MKWEDKHDHKKICKREKKGTEDSEIWDFLKNYKIYSEVYLPMCVCVCIYIIPAFKILDILDFHFEMEA